MNDHEKKAPPSKETAVNNMEFVMGWYGRPVAKMKFSGADFGFDYESGWLLPLESYKTRQAGKEPMFLRSFLPFWAGIGSNRSNDKKANALMSKLFSQQELFLSNIAIVRSASQLGALGYDHLHGRLRDFTSDDGVFIGTQKSIDVMTREMETNMAQVAKEKRLTQISGAQTKISMHLSPQGELIWERDQPSTHIIKYAGFGGDAGRVRGAAEWAGMTLARAGGVVCADFALIEMPSEGGHSLNYLTERFDLPVSKEDERLIFCEEVGAAMGYRPDPASSLTLNEVIDALMEFSTNKRGDMAELFKQVAANCILENADFHARNMSLLKVAAPTLDSFRSVRLSPAYDVMRTRDFSPVPIPDGESEEMQLCFTDPQSNVIEFDKPTLAHFQMVGNVMGLSGEQSEKMLYNVAAGMLDKAIFLKHHQPGLFDNHELARQHVIETSEVVIKNTLSLFPGLHDKVEMQGCDSEPARRPGPRP